MCPGAVGGHDRRGNSDAHADCHGIADRDGHNVAGTACQRRLHPAGHGLNVAHSFASRSSGLCRTGRLRQSRRRLSGGVLPTTGTRTPGSRIPSTRPGKTSPPAGCSLRRTSRSCIARRSQPRWRSSCAGSTACWDRLELRPLPQQESSERRRDRRRRSPGSSSGVRDHRRRRVGAGSVQTLYVVELGDGRYLVAETYRGPDYDLAKGVLDDMMRTLVLVSP